MGACTNEDAQVVKLLLSKGANIHARDGTKVCYTIIQWFFWRGLSNCDERHQIQRFEHLYSYSTLLLKQT